MTVQILYLVLPVVGLLILFDVLQQSRDVWGLLRYLKRERAKPDRSEGLHLPRAAVILSLRGPDPQLQQTLSALMSQEYPDFRVHVVVDNEKDPVLADVTAIQKQYGADRIAVSVLLNPSRTCSLKCSSLIQAIHELESDIEVVAFIDGDVVPHQTWLRELVLPVANGEADVAGGNRWYLPPDARPGTMSRYFWNAAYLTGMWAQGAPWAGTMAFHRETADRIGLLDAWSRAMSVDATLHRCMQAHQLRFKLVESLIMVNRETIGLSSFHRWVTRQMAVIRYSASATVRMAEIQVGILLVMHTLLPVSAATAFVAEADHLGWTATAALCGYWLFCSLRMILIERSMRKSIARRGESTHWVNPLKVLCWYPAVVVTHFVIGTGVVLALRLKQVDWRGIKYQLAGNGVVSMSDYQPYGSEWVRTDNRSII